MYIASALWFLSAVPSALALCLGVGGLNRTSVCHLAVCAACVLFAGCLAWSPRDLGVLRLRKTFTIFAALRPCGRESNLYMRMNFCSLLQKFRMLARSVSEFGILFWPSGLLRGFGSSLLVL